MALRQLFSLQRISKTSKLCPSTLNINSQKRFFADNLLRREPFRIFNTGTENIHNCYKTSNIAKNCRALYTSIQHLNINKDISNDGNAKTTSAEKPAPLLSQLFPQTSPNDIEDIERERKKDEENDKKEKEDAWRKMKIGFGVFGISISLMGGCLVIEYGLPSKDEQGNYIEDEFSSLPVPKQYFVRLWTALMFYQKLLKEPSSKHLLPDPLPYPYIQPPYTLVIELTDVLVHPDWTYQTGWRFKKRPGLDHFLEQVAPPLFEIVIFTAEQGMTAFPIIDALDPNGYIMYRLVRDATHFVDGHHVKNLDNLNRDLSKVIVVDWNANSVKFHRQNTFQIQRWKGNDNDTTLVDLAAFLKTIATSEVSDVRDVLTYYEQFDDPLEAFRENQRKLLEKLEQEEHAKTLNKSLTTKWSSSFRKH